jgi:hypothetical protein
MVIMLKVNMALFFIMSIITNSTVYAYLTIASEICGVVRMAYPEFYVVKVCIDMIREIQKIVLLNK